MTLKDIIQAYENLRVYEKRGSNREYDERVLLNEDIDQWNKIFTAILGPAIKKAGVEPTEEHQQLTKDFGGIWDNQTLFKKEFDDSVVIAMFLPWQDDIHTTVKTVYLKK